MPSFSQTKCKSLLDELVSPQQAIILNQMNTLDLAIRVRKRPEKAHEEYLVSTKRRLLSLLSDGSTGSSALSDSLAISSKIVELNDRAMRSFTTGDYAVAIRLFQDAVDLRQSATAALRQAEEKQAAKNPPPSSYIYQRMDFDEGMDVYSDVESVNLDDHPVAAEATLLFNMGQVRRKMEDYEMASAFYYKALSCLIPYLDSLSHLSSLCVHKVVIPVLHNLGQLAYKQGNLNDAIMLYELALKHCCSFSGSDSLCVGLTLNCLGVLYYHAPLPNNSRSLTCLREAFAIVSARLGSHSTVTATVLNNLGRSLVQREDFAGAICCYEKALVIRKSFLGPDHVDYAATAFNAGQSYHQLRQYERAVELYNEFLRVAMKKFSHNHRDIAVVLSGIAQIHQERKEYEMALDLYRKSLCIGRAALGTYHSEVAMLLNRLGNFHFERQDLESALRAYKLGLKIEEKVLEKAHPNTIVTLSNIGEIYRLQGKFNRAIKLYTRAMELQKLRHGPNSAEVAGALNVIGLIYDQKGEAALALKCLQDALVMRRIVLGDDHLDVSATMTYLGTIFYRRNMITTALQLFNESLRIRIAHLGHDHRDVSFTLYNIGLCHQLQGSFKNAIACFRETLRVEEAVLGSSHKDVALTLFKLGEALKADGKIEEALEALQRALCIEREQDETANAARTLTEIGNIHLTRGDANEMMHAFVEAARLFRRAGLAITSVSVAPSLKLYAAPPRDCAPAA